MKPPIIDFKKEGILGGLMLAAGGGCGKFYRAGFERGGKTPKGRLGAEISGRSTSEGEGAPSTPY